MGDPTRDRTLFPPCTAVPLRYILVRLLNSACCPVAYDVRRSPTLLRHAVCLLLLCLLAGCSFRQDTPTRTPLPTWTPTVNGQQVQAETPVVQVTLPATDTPLAPPPTDTPAVEPPTPLPTDTPIAPEAPSPTPVPTDTPATTPTPEPTATAAYLFTLEAAEKFPTDSLAANVVRIYLYVYSPTTYGLADYTLQVAHNGSPLTVDEVSTGGVPEQTRPDPGPFTRFANMSVVFVEPQAGRWDVQLLDPQRTPVGPPVTFELTADERTRELYIRYRQQ